MKTWDILVPTFYARTPLFVELLDQLERQIRPGVRVVAARGERDPEHIASKQQQLLDASDADYVCICADDARLHPEYVSLIHAAMQSGPDAIGFKLQLCDQSGPITPPQHHSIAFQGVAQFWAERWCDCGTWMPVKRDIAGQVRFADEPGDADATWTRAILNTGLLRTEFYFNEVLVMPQVLDLGFHGAWEAVEPTPNPERPFLRYV